MLRGINRQDIFGCDWDRQHFMTVLKECKEISGFKLHAFCLMPNHIHFLIEPTEEPLNMIFKRIGTRYAVWYNRKYQRAGHLFQDRFRSENVETDQYYMTVLRYILQNPMKAGIEKRPGSYRWSSYLAYEKGIGALTDTQYALNLFGSHDAMIDFLRQHNEDIAMDEADHDWRLRDDQAEEIFARITPCSSASEFKQLGKEVRQKYILELYQEGLSMSQVSRLTGISTPTVSRVLKRYNDLNAEQQKNIAFHESDAYAFNMEDIIW